MEQKAIRYMGVFYLPKPQREHGKISEVLRAVAKDVKQIVLGGNTVIYFFVSEVPPHNISFSQVLHTGDQAFFIEVGEYSTARDFGAVQGWLNSHPR